MRCFGVEPVWGLSGCAAYLPGMARVGCGRLMALIGALAREVVSVHAEWTRAGRCMGCGRASGVGKVSWGPWRARGSVLGLR